MNSDMSSNPTHSIQKMKTHINVAYVQDLIEVFKFELFALNDRLNEHIECLIYEETLVLLFLKIIPSRKFSNKIKLDCWVLQLRCTNLWESPARFDTTTPVCWVWCRTGLVWENRAAQSSARLWWSRWAPRSSRSTWTCRRTRMRASPWWLSCRAPLRCRSRHTEFWTRTTL